MLICGIKLSHDGGVAVIDGNRLILSIECEKLGNNARYSSLGDLDLVREVLDEEGIHANEIDCFVVDGWHATPGDDTAWVRTACGGHATSVEVAPYTASVDHLDPLDRRRFGGAQGLLSPGYSSYSHVSSHVLGAYCTSPFAKCEEDALVLAWDGGMLPWLYHVEAGKRRVQALGPIFLLVGNLFGSFCTQLEPFRCDAPDASDEQRYRQHLEVPGKAMAYAALGRVEPAAFDAIEALLVEIDEISDEVALKLARGVLDRRKELFPGLSDANLIATVQAWVGEQLVASLRSAVAHTFPGENPNLCLTGGCALNIKWNSLLRDSALFREIWVPPFPNDSGAALGTACCEMIRQTGSLALDWDVYQGPQPAPIPPCGSALRGWESRACDERALAGLLHREGEPVVVVDGRAALGPRALGNRSILAPATDPRMKDRLNALKGREPYRPVAPMCLTGRAAEVFAANVGPSDKYMTFEHAVRSPWRDRVPAIAHLDGSARLQVIDATTPSTRAGRILQEYERLSGIPVLCNTSANLPGSGLFPDLETVAKWGRTRYLWSGGVLYTNPDKRAAS